MKLRRRTSAGELDPMNVNIICLETVGSTNSEALDQARRGADEGLCIISRQQTAGRGRHGRTWISPKDSGLYFSIVLRPVFEAGLLPLITLMAGVAVYDTLTEFGLAPDIKWVNDILVNEKKIAGILAETTETDRGLAVIVGIGINLRSSHFPPEIAQSATSLEAEGTRAVEAAEVETALIRYLGYFYEVLSARDGPAEIVKEWHRRSSYSSGKKVSVHVGREAIIGVTDGLEANGALRIKRPGGDVAIVHAGDVQLLRGG